MMKQRRLDTAIIQQLNRNKQNRVLNFFMSQFQANKKNK